MNYLTIQVITSVLSIKIYKPTHICLLSLRAYASQIINTHNRLICRTYKHLRLSKRSTKSITLSDLLLSTSQILKTPDYLLTKVDSSLHCQQMSALCGYH
jgi:hypothetical protein